MRGLQAFFLLAARPAMFWLGAFSFGCLSFLLVALGNPEETPSRFVDAVILVALAYPLLAGWLAGALVQEVQHASFSWVLPRARRRIAVGFLILGIGITLVTVALIAARGTPCSPIVLAALGLSAFCLGGVLMDPLSGWASSATVSLALAATAGSRWLGTLCVDNPPAVVIAALLVGVIGFHRLFAVSTFRRKPFRPTVPLPGAYSFNQSLRREREQAARLRGPALGWRGGYLGGATWSWVRAGTYEAYGLPGMRAAARMLWASWPLWLVFAVHAFEEKGEGSYWEALGKSIHDALIRSPHVPRFGEEQSYGIVVIVIASLGGLLALWTPVALRSGLLYPLSRSDLARVTYLGGLVDVAVYAGAVGLALLALGQAAGWLVGYAPRFDFVPFFLRPMATTVILMPLAQIGRLHLEAAAARRVENLQVALIVGLIAFVVVACVWTFASSDLLGSSRAELATSAVLLMASQALYRRALGRHFATADLV